MRKIVYALACITGIVLHACQSYEERREKESRQDVKKIELSSDTAKKDSAAK